MSKSGFAKKLIFVAACSMLAAFDLSGCGSIGETKAMAMENDAVLEDSSKSTEPEEIPQEPEVIKVEKETLSENNITDNKDLYDFNNENSVITMYLTVSSGNKADGSDHTWSEVNTYSTYDYEQMGIDRYKVEGLLKIDEKGEGIDESSFGFNETVPNVSVQVRGQTSSIFKQKNYKIRIKDGKGEFRGQRTLNLNKHMGDPFRFLNKLCYDLLDPIPQLIGGRTQFVHLYVKDLTDGGIAEYSDYGLYTMVEQVNRTYLKTHGLDENGHLYKVTFFEWNKYDAIMTPLEDPDFDEKEFEKYLEIKGNHNPEKLQEVIDKVNNHSIPIDDIIEEHFDAENLSYWMAFNILNGNCDIGARNLFMYSPLNSEKFYMICWDMDVTFKNNFNRWNGYNLGTNWESGMTKFLGIELIKRMMKEDKYRTMLENAVEDLHNNYVTESIIADKVNKYRDVTLQYIYENPDNEFLQIEDIDTYYELTSKIPHEVEENYEKFKLSMKTPWPFFIGKPYMNGDDLVLGWDASYDYNGEDITYSFVLAHDIDFNEVIDSGEGLKIPLTKTSKLPEGMYYLRVIATNESGYSMGSYDYMDYSDRGKKYDCYGFIVEPDGTIEIADQN